LLHLTATLLIRYGSPVNEEAVLIIHELAWIGLSSVLRPRHHSTGYMGDGFYRSKDPTNIIKVRDAPIRQWPIIGRPIIGV